MEEHFKSYEIGKTVMDINSLQTTKSTIEELLKSLSLKKETIEKRILYHQEVLKEINETIGDLSGKNNDLETSDNNVLVSKEHKELNFGLITPDKEESIREACKRVVNLDDNGLRPYQVVKILSKENHPKSKNKSFNSAVPHNLKYLVQEGEIDSDEKDGNIYYKRKKAV